MPTGRDTPLNTERASSRSKHTPGPWQVERGADGWPLITTGKISGGYTESVASVCRHALHVQMAGVSITPEATDANARLMAAAPDLFAALRACVGLIEAAHAAEQEDWRPGFDDVELTPDGSLRLSDARAALAKASGEPT